MSGSEAVWAIARWIISISLRSLRFKIDGSYVRHIADDADTATTVRTMIELRHRYHLTTVAECVETSAQFEMLVRHDCDHYQGYLLSKPLPTAECFHLLQQRSVSVQPQCLLRTS